MRRRPGPKPWPPFDCLEPFTSILHCKVIGKAVSILKVKDGFAGQVVPT